MPEARKTAEKASAKQDSGEDQVQAAFDEANEKGYFGTSPDKTPRENYTVAGVTSGKPTPESEAAKKRAEEAGR